MKFTLNNKTIEVTEDEFNDSVSFLEDKLEDVGDDIPERPAYRFVQKLMSLVDEDFEEDSPAMRELKGEISDLLEDEESEITLEERRRMQWVLDHANDSWRIIRKINDSWFNDIQDLVGELMEEAPDVSS